MSEFRFACPSCSQHIACDTSYAGMTIACPACQTRLIVPQPPSGASNYPPAQPASPQPPPVPPGLTGAPGLSISQSPPPPPPAHPALSIAASQARHTASEAGHHAQMVSHTYAQPQTPPPGGQKTSGLAIASLVCSLVSCPGFIPGIICGHLARRNIRRDPALKGNGLAIAGLIISYFTLVFFVVFIAAGMPGFIRAFKEGYNQAKEKQEARTGTGRTSTSGLPAAKEKNAEVSTAPDDTNSFWNLNLTTAAFPDQPAAGKIRGQVFTVESATAQNGNITLRQGTGSAGIQIIIFTFLKNGESLAGKSYDISPADTFSGTMPHVHVLSKDDSATAAKQKVYKAGYALKLALGAADQTGGIPGKIYLCLPDDDKSYVAGSFNLQVKKAPARKKKPRQPAAGTN